MARSVGMALVALVGLSSGDVPPVSRRLVRTVWPAACASDNRRRAAVRRVQQSRGAIRTPSASAQLREPAAGAAPVASHAPATVPFRGTFENTQTLTPLTPPLVMVDGRATGEGTQLGRFDVAFPHTVNFATATGVGTYTFTAANGDVLTATFTGQAQVGPVTSIVEQATITGGTGRFAGATGSFTSRRLFHLATGTTTGSFEGTISAAGANGH